MADNRTPRSPAFPEGHQWTFTKRKGVYESDVTAMVRRMLEDDAIRNDQRIAWERWRNDPAGLRR